jgi:hypothetical protein
MGAINFNPAQVLEGLSRDRGSEFSRLASLAGVPRQNRIFGSPQVANTANVLNRRYALEIENSGGTPAKLANLLNSEAPEAKRSVACPANLPASESPEANYPEAVVNPANSLIRPDSENQKSEGTPANLANLLNGEGPTEWLRGLATLDPNRPPADFGGIWWRDLIRDAERFLPLWGQQAADLGWTTLDLFGVHRLAPAARFSSMGLLLLVRGGRVVAITAGSAVIERQSKARLTYTRRPPEPQCAPIWELGPPPEAP